MTTLVQESESQYAGALKSNPHLKRYLEELDAEYGVTPSFINRLDDELAVLKEPNLIYPVGDPVFVHIFATGGKDVVYNAIEPQLSKRQQQLYDNIMDKVLKEAAYEQELDEMSLNHEILERLYEKVVKTPNKFKMSIIKNLGQRMGDVDRRIVKYHFFRNLEGNYVLEPLIRDPYLEDIHSIGLENIFIVHKVFKMVETNLKFQKPSELNTFLASMAERMGKPISNSSPIVDGALPDGSRVNVVAANDVSLRGSSFTIRKFSATPLSFPRLVAYNSYSPEQAAYLWMAMENGMNIFVCGETASGKTTALNALLPFVDFNRKIYTCESSPEVLPPHQAWQQMLTREAGPEDSRVDMMDLLVAALRSRPDLVVVGEIRGVEGNIAFQAMQTGHPVLATFHAATVRKLVQRFTGEPINVPMSFMDNLNICVMQNAIYTKGRILRRCTNISEIVGYSEEVNKIMTRTVFTWDPVTDVQVFKGMNNSYVLEEIIANKKGYYDTRKIYDDMAERTKIIRKMVELKLYDYHESNKIFQDYRRDGVASLPFSI